MAKSEKHLPLRERESLKNLFRRKKTIPNGPQIEICGIF
jgi:hypothetical protein